MDHQPLGQPLRVRNCSSVCSEEGSPLLGSSRKEPLPGQEQFCSVWRQSRVLGCLHRLQPLLALPQFSPGVLPVCDVAHGARRAGQGQSLGCAASAPQGWLVPVLRWVKKKKQNKTFPLQEQRELFISSARTGKLATQKLNRPVAVGALTSA